MNTTLAASLVFTATSAFGAQLTVDGGSADIVAGDVHDGVLVLNSADVSLSGGTIKDGLSIRHEDVFLFHPALAVYDDSTFTMTSGIVERNSHFFDMSEAYFSGGELQDPLYLHGFSSAVVDGGSFIGFKLRDDSVLVMNGGAQTPRWSGEGTNLEGRSSFTLNAGEPSNIGVYEESSLTVNGGHMRGEIIARTFADVTINGGVIGAGVDIGALTRFVLNDGLIRVKCAATHTSSPDIEIRGGRVLSSVYVAARSGNVRVSDGTMEGGLTSFCDTQISGGDFHDSVINRGGLMEISGGVIDGDLRQINARCAVSGGTIHGDVILHTDSSDPGSEIRFLGTEFTYDHDADPMTPNIAFDFAGQTELVLDRASSEFNDEADLGDFTYDVLRNLRVTFANGVDSASDVYAVNSTSTGWAGTLVLELVPSSVDLNSDGVVDSGDLAILLAGWGGSGPADLNGDGLVDSTDLAILLAAWG